MDIHTIRGQSRWKIPRAPEMAKQTGVYVSFQAEGKLLAKVARQGKVGPLITKGGLKSDGHNLPIGLKSGPVGSTVQIAERGAHLAADTEGIVE